MQDSGTSFITSFDAHVDWKEKVWYILKLKAGHRERWKKAKIEATIVLLLDLLDQTDQRKAQKFMHSGTAGCDS